MREETRDDPTLKSAQKSRGGHPSFDGTADCLLRDCGSVGHRHRAMADETKRTSRDLGAAPPDQKPAWPASEVVRGPVHRSARQQGRGGQGPPLRSKRRASRRRWFLQGCRGNCWHTGRISTMEQCVQSADTTSGYCHCLGPDVHHDTGEILGVSPVLKRSTSQKAFDNKGSRR